MDEMVMAGGKWNTENTSYYLYNGQDYWTMTPSCAHSSRVFRVYGDGQLSSTLNVNYNNGVRPVINLKADTTFSGGNGTLNSPYIVS